jgi:hypothetical protein
VRSLSWVAESGRSHDRGPLTNTNITNALCGATIADLVQSMQDGTTYVNVHTVVNPGGEIRGQIRTAGPDNGG